LILTSSMIQKTKYNVYKKEATKHNTDCIQYYISNSNKNTTIRRAYSTFRSTGLKYQVNKTNCKPIIYDLTTKSEQEVSKAVVHLKHSSKYQ